MIGTALGGYRISAKLGQGGMGEVWRATDGKLGREVALKVLPAAVASDPERLARFEREARVLASLNHPSIATLFGLETFDGVPVLVMELVEGEDLSERIARGAVPAAEAMPIALQIAQALETAHEKGIVHRDLKPANVKVTADGKVKVLDFGLAKAWAEETAQGGLSFSPTMTRHDTQAGVILGTAAYMAPEQAAGLATDRRADIWSFGVVLWEMLTGRKLFEGETVSHVLAAVLKDTPDLACLPKDLPPVLSGLVGSCLRKKPARRLQSIGDARVTLEDWLAQPEAFAPAAPPPAAGARSRLHVVLPWVVAATGLTAGLVGALLASRSPAAPVVKAGLPAPDGEAFYLDPESPGPVAVSPDGRRVAFSAQAPDGKIRLFVRDLDAAQARPLPGTEGAGYQFWSPDSRWLGFTVRQDRVLRKIHADGGAPPVTLCRADNAKGGSWSPEGTIVFAPDAVGPLHRVSSSGGTSRPITRLDGARHSSHRHPRFLPDGRRFLFFARGLAPDQGAVFLGSLDESESREIVPARSQAEYASGRLLFVRERALVAQPFDAAKGTLSSDPGDAVPLAEDVLVVPGAALSIFSASSNGVLAYLVGQAELPASLEWRDREGKLLGTLGEPARQLAPQLSPDGRFAAVPMMDGSLGTHDIWIYDVARGLRTRFTFEPAEEFRATWAPDSRTVYFASNVDGVPAIYRKAVEGTGEVELVFRSQDSMLPTSLSPDGKLLLASRVSSGASATPGAVVLDLGKKAEMLRGAEFAEEDGMFSPDGKWVAYTSQASGRSECFVSPFPGPGRRWQVSTSGGQYPQWRADGRELFWVQNDGWLVSAEVSAAGDTFRVGTVSPLFRLAPSSAFGAGYSPTRDGKRFLVAPRTAAKPGSLLTLVLGWPSALGE